MTSSTYLVVGSDWSSGYSVALFRRFQNTEEIVVICSVFPASAWIIDASVMV